MKFQINCYKSMIILLVFYTDRLISTIDDYPSSAAIKLCFSLTQPFSEGGLHLQVSNFTSHYSTNKSSNTQDCNFQIINFLLKYMLY